MTTAQERYLAAVSSGDRDGALDVVRRMQLSGAGPLEVMTEVVAPTQAAVGRLWATDAWSVAQEHSATAVSEAVLGMLGAQIPAPLEASSPVVVCCVEQEWHALPALLVAEHLRSAGVPVSYLGANTSPEHLVRHVHETGPRAVALSCSLGASLPRVRRQVEAVRATGTPVLVGGAAFDSDGHRARVLGANGFAVDGAGAVLAARDLPVATTPAPPLTHDGADEGLAIHADREALGSALHRRVTAATEAGHDGLQPWRTALADQLPHLVGTLAGALVADDRTVLDDSVAWLGEVMRHRAAPPDLVDVVVAGLAVEAREHPVAARMLSGAARGA